jgi:hypothetical protein
MITLTDTTISVHRLVQTVTRAHDPGRDSIDDHTISHPGLTAGALLAEVLPPDPMNNVAGWPSWRALLPHVDRLAECLPGDTDDSTMSFLLARPRHTS